jgi:hypothetical protein
MRVIGDACQVPSSISQDDDFIRVPISTVFEESCHFLIQSPGVLDLHDASIRESMTLERGPQGAGADAWLEQIDRLGREKSELGRNSLLMCLSLTGEDASPPVYLHPQLLCDWGLAQETIRHFLAGMPEAHGWSAPYIPPLEVRD